MAFFPHPSHILAANAELFSVVLNWFFCFLFAIVEKFLFFFGKVLKSIIQMKKIFFFGNNLHWETSENLSFLLYTPREERERAANAINIVIVVSMVLYQFKIIFFLSYKCALHIKRLNVDSGSQRREKMAHPVNNAARKYETAKKMEFP